MCKRKFLFCLLFISFYLNAQDDIEIIDEPYTYYDLNLDQVINTKISVSSAGDLTVREAPAIVMVVTSDEIKAMGARDLMEVLNLLPGYNFGLDVAGVMGIANRGIWGHEGKILLQLDGQELNDITYLTSSYGQHIDVSLIDRIEIIRGPSSSIYGGTASMGMVKIVTKSADKLKGLHANASYGQLNNLNSRSTLSLAYGNSYNNIVYSINTSFASGRRSNSIYSDVYGNNADLTDLSSLKTRLINLALKIDQFSFRFIHDHYVVESPIYFDQLNVDTIDGKITNPTDFSQMGGTYLEADYEWMNDGYTKLNTSVKYKYSVPWGTEKNSPFLHYEIHAQQINPSINYQYRSDEINLLSGMEMDFDSGTHYGELYEFPDGSKSVSYHNIAAFAQLQLKETPIPLIIGARLDNHSHVGSAFTYKFALVDLSDTWHYKLLYGRSFRAPGIENLRFNLDLKPEYSTVFEGQFGYVLSQTMSISATYYRVQVTDPLVYYYTEEFPLGNYVNYNKSKSSGIELEFRYQGELGFIASNFSYMSNAGNKNDAYEVSTIPDRLLAWPSKKINLYSGLRFIPNLTVSPSISYISQRYGVISQTPDFIYSYKRYSKQLFFNLNLQYTLTTQIDLNLMFKDLSDEGQYFIQPHNSGARPIKGIGREFIFGASFHPEF